VISVIKRTVSAAYCNGLEDAESDTQLLAYQNKNVMSFSTHSSQLKCRVTSHSSDSSFSRTRNERSDVKRSSNTNSPMNCFPVVSHQMFTAKTVVKMCLRGCVGISDWPDVLPVPSLLNLATSVQKSFVWRCWCSKGPRQNSARTTNQLFVSLHSLRRRGCRPALPSIHHTCIRLRPATWLFFVSV